jgi:hypothetical protein
MGITEGLSEFLNDPNELHSLWFGFTDAVMGFKPGDPDMPESLAEPHYYRLGLVLGKAAIFGAGMVVMGLILK